MSSEYDNEKTSVSSLSQSTPTESRTPHLSWKRSSSAPSWAVSSTADNTPTSVPCRPFTPPEQQIPIPSIDTKIQSIVKLRKQPECLNTRFKLWISCAVIEAELATYTSSDRDKLIQKFGLDYAKNNIRFTDQISTTVALTGWQRVLLVYMAMGKKPENLFTVAPIRQGRYKCYTDETGENSIPQTLSLKNVVFNLKVRDNQLDFSGRVSHSVLEYENQYGEYFQIIATRIPIRNQFGRDIPTLKLGNAQAPNWILGAAEIDLYDINTVIIPFDLHVALRIRQFTSPITSNSEYVVSGVIGGSDEFTNMDMASLSYRRIIIIPEASPKGIHALDTVVKACKKMNVHDILIFPYPIIYAPIDAYLPEIWLEKALHLDQVIDADRWVEKIIQSAVPPAEANKLFELIGLYTSDNSHGLLPSGQTHFFNPDEVGDFSQPTTLIDVHEKHIFKGIVMIHAVKDRKKSLMTLIVMANIIKGKPLWGVFSAEGTSHGLLVDSETLPERLKANLGQFNLNEELQKHFWVLAKKTFQGKKNEGEEGVRELSYDLLDDVFQSYLLSLVSKLGLGYVVLDNETSLISEGKIYSSPSMGICFKFYEELNKAGSTAIVVHHSKEVPSSKNPADYMMRGTSESSIRAHTEIVMLGVTDMNADTIPEIVLSVEEQDPHQVVGVYFKYCKLAYILQGKTLWVHLPLGASEVIPICIVDQDKGTVLWTPNGGVLDHSPTVPTSSQSHFENDANKVLSLFKDRDTITRKDVESLLHCKADKARACLHTLMDHGYLESMGGGRSTRYHLLK